MHSIFFPLLLLFGFAILSTDCRLFQCSHVIATVNAIAHSHITFVCFSPDFVASLSLSLSHCSPFHSVFNGQMVECRAFVLCYFISWRKQRMNLKLIKPEWASRNMCVCVRLYEWTHITKFQAFKYETDNNVFVLLFVFFVLVFVSALLGLAWFRLFSSHITYMNNIWMGAFRRKCALTH